jgi:hypothetical protein
MKMHENHSRNCKVKTPVDGRIGFGLKPSNYSKMLRLPFAFYADFECTNEPCQSSDAMGKTRKAFKHIDNSWKLVAVDEKGNVIPQWTHLYRGDNSIHTFGEHVWAAVEALWKGYQDSRKKINQDTVGPDHKIATVCHICLNKAHDGFENLTDAEWKLYNKYKALKVSGTACTEFKQQHKHVFEKMQWTRVCDHDHSTGNYRGAAHNKCNVNFTANNCHIPVFFHNFKGYDEHIMLKHLKRIGEDDQISATCINSEKYKSVSWKRPGLPKLKFLDSCEFLQATLKDVVEEMAALPGRAWVNMPRLRDFVVGFMKKQRPDATPQDLRDALDLLACKGVYPYEWSDPERFKHRGMFPFHELRKNTLNGIQNLNTADARFTALHDKQNAEALRDFEHAKAVYSTFNLATFGEYHDLYLNCDTYQLADAMELFRRQAHEDPDIGLDPAWFEGVPGLTYNAAMKFVERNLPDVKLEVLVDTDMLSMVMASKRGGICQVKKRYAKANNYKYLGAGFDRSKSSSYIIYLDANNLYGKAMSEYLPTGNFKFVEGINKENIREFLKQFNPTSKQGCYLEVDLHAPDCIHDKLNGYSLAPEMKYPPHVDQMSGYQQAVRPMGQTLVQKLILDFEDKHAYVLNYQNLQYMLDNGYEVQVVHHALVYDQAPWLQAYIDKMTQKRKQASAAGNDRMSGLYKLMVNSLYGRLCMNVLGRTNFQLCWNGKQFKKYSKLCTFKGARQFNDELMGVIVEKTEILVDTPLIAGMTVLELSKLHMQRFHHDVMCKRFGGGDCKPTVNLMYTDTDSLVYEISYDDAYKPLDQRGDAYADMARLGRQYFDMSGFKHTMPKIYDPYNAKMIGMFKDETSDAFTKKGDPPPGEYDNVIEEAVFLRSKLYAIRLRNGNEKKKAKGATRSVVDNEMFFDDYYRVLVDSIETKRPQQHLRNMSTIRSYQHQVYLETQENRVVLSAFEDKSYWSDDGINCLDYGHYKTKQVHQSCGCDD